MSASLWPLHPARSRKERTQAELASAVPDRRGAKVGEDRVVIVHATSSAGLDRARTLLRAFVA